MKAIAKRMGKEDELEELIINSQSILPPEGASEIEIKVVQVCRSCFEFGFEILLYGINRYTQAVCFFPKKGSVN